MTYAEQIDEEKLEKMTRKSKRARVDSDDFSHQRSTGDGDRS